MNKQEMAIEIEKANPGLKNAAYKVVKSKIMPQFNCVAWAIRDTSRKWWPYTDGSHYWPDILKDRDFGKDPRKDSNCIAFIQMLKMLQNYEVCNLEDREFEKGFEKIAIYEGGGITRHLARQLTNGDWTSKIGEGGIIHHKLRDLEGTRYGTVKCILKRPFPKGWEGVRLRLDDLLFMYF